VRVMQLWQGICQSQLLHVWQVDVLCEVWWWQKDQWVGDCSRAVSDKATDSELRLGEVEEAQGQDKKAGSVGEKPRR
jgi:hypothetical protein